MNYLEIPSSATQLRPARSTNGSTNGVRPAQKVYTSIPTSTPPPSPSRMRSDSSSSSLSSPTFSLLPQMLFSTAIPAQPSGSSTNPRKGGKSKGPVLLTNRDPLSIPITTNNFKRFVARVGPIFWVQDRIEEIMFWRRGWRMTCSWMALYAFLCYYPRFVFMIPHVALIATILATYPYGSAHTTTDAPPAQAAEGSVPWQANLQAIQNLMGFVADTHSLVVPYTHHLSLAPRPATSDRPRTSYAPHILTLLVVTFPPLLFLVSHPAFPIRTVCLVGGLAPFIINNPEVQRITPILLRFVLPILEHAFRTSMRWLSRHSMRVKFFGKVVAYPAELVNAPLPSVNSAGSLVQRLIDDDRLMDECWNAEMREVELWENERFGGAQSPAITPATAGIHESLAISTSHGGWSKANLKPGERTAWTRGRDGWSGVGNPNGDGGEVSSNLTFSLAPGWVFVHTEDWRKDVAASWAECGGDEDGWVYTNEVWLNPRPVQSGPGFHCVTRRRRWTRRVWYDSTRVTQ
ncbi:hypothetical protein AX16_005293 [Volvariella volvacea WC 439]|nr:hypothetical protein AX16_005293 [Volvariella volvacea WC 439]